MVKASAHINRAPSTRWVPIAAMKVLPQAQREFNQAQADGYAADFDLEALGYPVVNARDGVYYILDGQHRIEALRIMGWNDQSIECEVYTDLTDQQMAELFLRRDERRAVQAFEKFRIALTAERDMELDIDRITKSLGLKVSTDRQEGSIKAVGSLRWVYLKGGAGVLRQTLRIIRDAYESDGRAFEVSIIRGLGLFVQRYTGEFDEERLVSRLAAMQGLYGKLNQQGEVIRRATGQTKASCIAAAVTEAYNGGRGGKKLANWWKETV